MTAAATPRAARHVAGTDPYPWPWHGGLDGDRLALVVAGAQRCWVERSVGVAGAWRAMASVAGAVRGAGGAVVAVRHGAPPGSPSDRRPRLPGRGSPAWQLDLGQVEPDVVVEAAGYDGFRGSPLDAVLRGRGHDLLLLAGAGAEVAVGSTLRSANDRGYECLVVADACAPLDAATGARDLASVTMSGGIFGAVGTAADVVAALSGPFETDRAPHQEDDR